MLQQQCVACNLMISDKDSTDKSCTCGHVFTERKLIGGKRFSEYRAELYSRLENKKQRHLTVREKKQVHRGTQEKDGLRRQTCSIKFDRHKYPSDEKMIKQDIDQRAKDTFTRPRVIRRPLNQAQIGKARLDAAEARVLQSLLRRFPSALAEINKRLASQNLLWFTLDTRARRTYTSDR